MAKYFDVGITHGANDTITHTLSTTLIGPQGKVSQFYPGNEWTPEQVVADVKKLAASAGLGEFAQLSNGPILVTH